jgi:hypothetical protein
MSTREFQSEIIILSQEIADLGSGDASVVVTKLLNLLERMAERINAIETEKQQLRDEINRLKGEQGKPEIKASKKKNRDISSEAERKEAEAKANENTEERTAATGNKTRQREPKLPKINIDREQICSLNKEGLPEDIEFKGYEPVVIQDLIIRTDNVKYLREVYYSPSQRKSYLGELPDEVRGQGEYGPGVRTLIPVLKTEGNMSEKRILGLFQNFGIKMSAAYISQQWTGGYEVFHQEKSDLYRAGLASSDFSQIDDTSARVNGTNQYCHIVCNPLFTAYFTREHKNRLSVLSVLTDGAPLSYLYNQHASLLLDTFNLFGKARDAVNATLPRDEVMNEKEFKAHLALIDNLGVRQSAHLAEACAIAYYHQQTDFPIIKTLLADDAPQFKLLTEYMALCWIHDGRHYKKLSPIVPLYQSVLTDFRSQYWAYYCELLKYKLEPNAEKKNELSAQFDALFSTTTDYQDLNDRIAKTLAKKTELLRVLEMPQLPLHNNDSELGARAQVRSRDVCFQTRSNKGTLIKDSFMTINQTAKKLGVCFYDYVFDRVIGSFKLPSLANLITLKAQQSLV